MFKEIPKTMKKAPTPKQKFQKLMTNILMCYLVSHDKLQLDNKYDENSIGDRSIPDNATTEALESL